MQREEREAVALAEERVRQARERAQALLLAHLDEEQRRQYEAAQNFYVQGRLGRYLLRVPTPGTVYITEGKYRGSRLCIQLPLEYEPCDAALARKLLIEADEDAFLKEACGLIPLEAAPPVAAPPVTVSIQFADGSNVQGVAQIRLYREADL